ncbi:MAG: tetratricopeptide repeat protein [Betaproteobacteria bacterium]|nr:tetratricopeptide repeat protein [Betaproteobacteria bacterium]
MPSAAIQTLSKMLEAGKDNALLRFSLGSEYLKVGEAENAVSHLRRAVEHDPGYSAAWKLLGKALTEAGRLKEALEAYRRGIEVAEKKGDKQAAKEMEVFSRRLRKELEPRTGEG